MTSLAVIAVLPGDYSALPYRACTNGMFVGMPVSLKSAAPENVKRVSAATSLIDLGFIRNRWSNFLALTMAMAGRASHFWAGGGLQHVQLALSLQPYRRSDSAVRDESIVLGTALTCSAARGHAPRMPSVASRARSRRRDPTYPACPGHAVCSCCRILSSSTGVTTAVCTTPAAMPAPRAWPQWEFQLPS